MKEGPLTLSPRESFDWLDDRKRRRGALAQIRRAIKAGWLDGPEAEARRDALAAALARLLDDPTLRHRELFGVWRVYRAIDGRPVLVYRPGPDAPPANSSKPA